MPGENRPGWVQYPDTPIIFPYVVWNRHKYEQEEGSGDFSDLVQLAKAINAPVDNNYRRNIEAILNIDEAIKALALDIMTGNWDGYQMAGNNYGVYNVNPPGQKPYFRWIMFDYDWPFLLGTSWFGMPIVNCSVYDALSVQPQSGWNRTLPSRVLELYRAEFTQHLSNFLSKVGQSEIWGIDANNKADRSMVAPRLISRIRSFANLSLPYTLLDNFASLDHDRKSPVDDVEKDMIPFVQIRFASAYVQLDAKDSTIFIIITVSVGVVLLLVAIAAFGFHKFKGTKSGYEGISDGEQK